MRVSAKQQEQNQPSTMRKAIGIAAGGTIGSYFTLKIIKYAIIPMSEKKLIAAQKFEIDRQPSIDSFENIKKYADKILEETGLAKKGYTINVLKPVIEKEGSTFDKIDSAGLSTGLNRIKKTIIINEKIGFHAVFHEIGHIMTEQKSDILYKVHKHNKLLYKRQPILGLACLTVGLLHNKKQATAEKPKSGFEKTKDFMHDYAGAITFLNFLPLLVEEAKASIIGVKIAKPYFPPEKCKQLAGAYFKHSFLSYLKRAAYPSIAVTLGIFVKDKIVQHKKSN